MSQPTLVPILCPITGETVYLPTIDSNSVKLSSVYNIVKATTLAYSDPNTNETKYLRANDVGVFAEPEGGWEDKLFVGVAIGDEDKYRVEEAKKLLFTIRGDDCVTAVKRRFAVTYAHGSHSAFTLGQVLSIRSVLNPTIRHDVEVVHESRADDFVVFKSLHSDICDKEPVFEGVNTGMPYFQLGVSEGKPTFNTGFVFSRVLTQTGHLRGTAGAVKGESGGGCFNKEGAIIGLVIGEYKSKERVKQEPIHDALKQLELLGCDASQTLIVPIHTIQPVIRKTIRGQRNLCVRGAVGIGVSKSASDNYVVMQAELTNY